MKTSRKMKTPLAAVLCVLLPLLAYAGDIVATGGFTRTVDSSDLSAGAGSDLESSYESAAGATTLDLSAAAGYLVYVSHMAGNWDAALTLYLKRTTPGSGAGSISGGDSYQEVTSANGEFFSGTLDRTGVDVQYKLDGISVDINPDTYTTTVFFTITDL